VFTRLAEHRHPGTDAPTREWKGRTRQFRRSAPAIAALWALQVRHEDLAAAAQEVGMWPM